MECRALAAQSLRQPGRQHTIKSDEAKPWTAGTIDHDELMSERDDFQVQQGARPEPEAKGVKERNDDGRHDRRLSENVRKLN